LGEIVHGCSEKCEGNYCLGKMEKYPEGCQDSMQNYKYPYVQRLSFCATLVNTHTHRHLVTGCTSSTSSANKTVAMHSLSVSLCYRSSHVIVVDPHRPTSFPGWLCWFLQLIIHLAYLLVLLLRRVAWYFCEFSLCFFVCDFCSHF